MRLLAGLLIAIMPTLTAAAELTIERLFDDPALSGPTPSRLKVSPDGERVTFLRGKADNQFQMDLWEYHVASKATRLLVDSAVLLPDGEVLSEAERARRERQRIAAWSGIVEYDIAPDGKSLLFPLNGELYRYDLTKQGRDAVRQLTHGEGFATDAKVSPLGRYVSFVRARNLWVIDLRDGKSYALTRDGGDAIANGEAEFVADEEMDRHTGYWWAPDDSKIAFARIDETPVPLRRRFEIYADRTEIVEQRYPAAGDANVAVKLGVISLASLKPDASPTPHWVPLEGDDLYLARVDWLPDSQRLAFQRQSRDQRMLDLVLYDPRSGTRRTLAGERSKTWVNLADDLHFFDDDTFLWSSEREGTRQLYLYGLDGREKHRVTKTDWPIDRVVAVDEKKGYVYVEAPGKDPIERHVFAYRLADGDWTQLTSTGATHSAKYSDDASIFVDTWSTPMQPPVVELREAGGKFLTTLEANRVEKDHPYAPYMAAHRLPEFGTIRNGDTTLHYRLTKPPQFDASKRYPVLVRVYGGPHVQYVQRAWDSRWGLLDQYYAQQGYLVWTLDNRGSARRGKAFEDALYQHMGTVEVEDQLAGVRWLKQQSYVDPKRVAVFGWSYGGYMSLMLLAKASPEFACGVAGAPVTDWSLYDTHYTERYMDHPKANAAGYADSAVFAHLDGLTSPLLLIHGMADDNVLFTHSTRLMSELQQRAQPFELMTYPGGKHGVAGAQNQLHLQRTMSRFLHRCIGAPKTP